MERPLKKNNFFAASPTKCWESAPVETDVEHHVEQDKGLQKPGVAHPPEGVEDVTTSVADPVVAKFGSRALYPADERYSKHY